MILCLLSSCSLQRQVQRQAHTLLLNDSLLQQAHTGICLYEPATGKYWFRHQEDHYFLPGSNVKLFTLFAALHCLGDSLPAVRYRTRDTGTLEILPAGDPTVLSSRFAYQPVPALFSSYPRVIIRWPDPPRPLGKGWAWDDFTSAYLPARSAMPLYENKMLIRRNAGGQISITPPALRSRMKGNATDWPGNLFPAGDLPGEVPEIRVPFTNDASTATALLRDTLRATEFAGPPDFDETTGPDRKFRVLYSQPLDSVLRPMMHRSDNFYAEQLLLMAANEYLGRMDEKALIDTLLMTSLRQLPDVPVWVDGSGLSRYNLCTPRSLVYLLDTLQKKYGADRLLRLLPTGGEGTLKNYFRSDSGFIFAKTGTLSHQSALSGILYTRQNNMLIFSVLINNARVDAAALRRATERFLSGIRRRF